MLRKQIERYLQQGKQLNLSGKTIANRRNVLYPLSDFLKGKSLTLPRCQEYISYICARNLKPSSYDCYVKSLRAFVTFMELPWAKKLLRPKLHRTPLDIIPAELAEQVILTGTDNNAVRLCLRLILRSGLRLEEARSLTPGSFNFEEETFQLKGKGGDWSIMPIPKDLIAELKLIRTPRLFPCTPKTLNKALKRGALKLGLRINMHVHLLRHICATSLLKSGIPLQIVSRILRHKNILLTDRVYSTYVIADLASAINGQAIVREGLTVSEIFQSVEKAVRVITEKDERFRLKVTEDKSSMTIKLQT